MRGQGSVEYLLLIVGALVLVAVAALLINSLLSTPHGQRDVQADIAEASAHHVWLNDYTTAYDGTEPTAPGEISYFGTGVLKKGGSVGAFGGGAMAVFSLQGEWELRILNKTGSVPGGAWLKMRDELGVEKWLQYGP